MDENQYAALLDRLGSLHERIYEKQRKDNLYFIASDDATDAIHAAYPKATIVTPIGETEDGDEVFELKYKNGKKPAKPEYSC